MSTSVVDPKITSLLQEIEQIEQEARSLTEKRSNCYAQIRDLADTQAGSFQLGNGSVPASSDDAPAPSISRTSGKKKRRTRKSGGSAAAVAASMCLAANGTDTGGSIRVPSAMNGIVGLKPTFGRVSKHGVVTLSWSLDHAGPITKTVEDAALMMNIIAGHDANDPSSVNISVPDYTKALREEIAGKKLGIPRENFLDPLDPDVADAFKKAVEVLKGLGAIVEEVSLPHVGLSSLVEYHILFCEASSYHERWLKTKAHLYTPRVAGLLKMGTVFPASHYIKAQRLRRIISDDFDAALRQVDALITPTLPITAPQVDEDEVSIGTGKMNLSHLCSRNMFPINLSGLPAITVPCGFSQGGLPVGLQIVGRPFDEEGIIGIANNYEINTDWHLRRPLL